MDRKSPFLCLILAMILLFTIGSFGFHEIPTLQAQPPLTIDMVYSASNRTDVRGFTYMGVHVVYTDSRLPVVGARVRFEGEPGQWYTEPDGWCVISIVSWDIGTYTLNVQSIIVGDISYGFQQTAPPASTKFDMVIIDLKSEETRIGVGTEAPISWDAAYASDGAPFEGELIFNYDNFTNT